MSISGSQPWHPQLDELMCHVIKDGKSTRDLKSLLTIHLRCNNRKASYRKSLHKSDTLLCIVSLAKFGRDMKQQGKWPLTKFTRGPPELPCWRQNSKKSSVLFCLSFIRSSQRGLPKAACSGESPFPSGRQSRAPVITNTEVSAGKRQQQKDPPPSTAGVTSMTDPKRLPNIVDVDDHINWTLITWHSIPPVRIWLNSGQPQQAKGKKKAWHLLLTVLPVPCGLRMTLPTDLH